MDECLLCLEVFKGFEGGIKVNSTQWQDLNIQNLIEKHLWCINPLTENSSLCPICWQELYEFHKFYVRVENVHSNVGKLLKTEIETELQQLEEKYNFVNEQHNKNTEHCHDLFSTIGDIQDHLETELLIIKEEKIVDDLKEDEDDDIPLGLRHKRKCTNKNIAQKLKATTKDPLKKSKKVKIKKSTIKPTALIKTSPNVADQTQIYIQTESNNLEISNEEVIPKISNNNDIDNETSSHSDQESTENNSINKSRTNRHKYDDFIAENFKISCHICDIPIDTFSAIIKHFHVEHNQRGYIMCCKRKLFDRTELIDHIHVHRNPEHFKCEDCGRVFADRSCLKLHIKNIHERHETNFNCDICGKVLSTKNGLKIHKHVKHEVKDRVTCTECKKTFRNKVSLTQHIKIVHLKKYVKICDLCGITIDKKDTFQRHMLEHEGKPIPTVACTICGRRYTNKRSLWRHKNLQHPTENTEFNCHICFKKFASQDNIKKHIKTVHELSYVNKCTICEKSFRRPDALRDHMARHTGTPLHSCPWCPKEFYSNGQMHAHRKVVHPQEWENSQREKFSGNLPPKYRDGIVKIKK